MKCPWVVSHDRLVALGVGCRVDSPGRQGFSEGRLTEAALDAIIDRKVNGPCGKIPEDSWTKASIHASNTVMSQRRLDDV